MEVTGTIVLFKKFKDMSSDSEFNNGRSFQLTKTLFSRD